MKSINPEQLVFISGLFVRAGLWISRADDTDETEDSEEIEEAHMLQAISRIAKMSKSEAVRACANLALKSTRQERRETEDTLTLDIRRAIEIFRASCDEQDLPQFQKALMYIATSVARAYREELDHHEDEFLLETFMKKISGALNRDADPVEFKNANISPAEDSALTMISKALKA